MRGANRFSKMMIVAMAVSLLTVAVGAEAGDGSSATVAGVLGLRPTETQSCVAIWVPIPEGQALAGFSWFNNDGSVVFPEILLESGRPNDPVTLSEARVMAENVQGTSLAWSQADLTEPVACRSAGLYVLFRFPVGSEYNADGVGGGAALGYQTDGSGYSGWISADGQDWVALSGEVGFALQPRFVSAADAVLVMNGARRAPRGQVPGAGETELFRATPNPFNPSTKLRFNLAQEGRIELAIYNLRGEKVRQIASGVYAAGPHEEVWGGRDDNGRGVASGVYFARLEAGTIALTQRLVLVQ